MRGLVEIACAREMCVNALRNRMRALAAICVVVFVLASTLSSPFARPL